MKIYYHRWREGQESCALFTGKIHPDSHSENASFATFSVSENDPQAPSEQGFPAIVGDPGLVTVQKHNTPSHRPAYLTLVADEHAKLAAHQEKHPPRGRHAKNSLKAVKATHKKTKAWLRLSADDRERRVLDFAFRSESFSWTLNLTPKKQAQLRKRGRPANYLADAINRACKRELGRSVPISLALEVTSTGRLHAHGIVTLERGEWKAFREALKSAGGKVEGRGAGRQTDTRKLWNATGWANYIAKDFDRTAEALGTEKVFYQCNATRAGARQEYEASLARQKALRRGQ
ncbi:hypothetical protein Rleg9DRAFT_2105 [Rhizobium leguminosarum bv. trifolii WSM597]|uniref:Uncharacterized protein n=1 Tax=Rhizobium leguminosarum bv. trifolii WSM597 TaxID=754764 RepID=J0H044_RHILT|nr:hypothetical protein [Rhizobium leguminosarum]EJB03273.1 hypothetical protein Rleg9DRAFT_2105 [Rhizobium leguminosarum bv. trifolii WSM597]